MRAQNTRNHSIAQKNAPRNIQRRISSGGRKKKENRGKERQFFQLFFPQKPIAKQKTMGELKILHTGDLHIGSFPGPEINGENARYLKIRHCLDVMVENARKDPPDIAIIAGDIFHQAKVWSDRGLNEQQTAVSFLRKLSRVCPVVAMRGTPNHDSEEQFNTLKSTFQGDGRVHIVTEPGLATYGTRRGDPIQVACVPGFDKGYFRAKNPGLPKEEENQAFTDMLKDTILGLRAKCSDDTPHILVSHYTIQGCNMESGQVAFFGQAEPIISPNTLNNAMFRLNCFGHIHRPQEVGGCVDTFYCGAVSALNFNDEGQPRGYYVHTLDGDGYLEGSQFIPLPTVEFKTIELGEEDITAINENLETYLETHPLDGVKDKIVRVIYECSDAANKAFSHNALEKALYEKGEAFWVQEVTPGKITMSVDQKSLEADGTPEGNLRDYLSGKDISGDDMEYLLKLASPIIQEALEETKETQATGLFTPLSIEVKNYRNYQEESFSFGDIDFCTVNGENGAGKSSLIMDAIADALFEEPREGDLTGWISNDKKARSGSIKFTFQVGDRTYRVTRTRQKSGKATLNLSEQVDGEWEDKSREKMKDTQGEVIRVLGMDSMALKACALIMQDQYGLFLQADKEARMEILGRLLGLSAYSTMEALASEKATETNREARTLAAKIETLKAGLPDREALEKEMEASKKAQEGAKKAIDAKTKEIQETQKEKDAAEKAETQVKELLGTQGTLEKEAKEKQAEKTSQEALIKEVDGTLAKEGEITGHASKYTPLLEKEKALIQEKAARDALEKQYQESETAAKTLETSIQENQKKAGELKAAKIQPLKEALSREPELAKSHKAYLELLPKRDQMQGLRPAYLAAAQALKDAMDKNGELEKQYMLETARLQAEKDALGKKTRLLEDSGCTDPGNAACKFLKDALEAKAALPNLENTLKDLAMEQENRSQESLAAIQACRQALDAIPYNEETLIEMEKELQGLTKDEQEYAVLSAKKDQLAILEAQETAARETIRKDQETLEACKAKLGTLKAGLDKTKDVAARQEALQKEIAEAKTWVEKLQQLPVLKERKNAAEKRALEIGKNLESIKKQQETVTASLETEQKKADGLPGIRDRLALLETELAALQETNRDTSVTLGRLEEQKGRLEKGEAEVKETKKALLALSKEAAGYETLKQAFSQDGVPHSIIRGILPSLEASATGILAQMSQGRMGVEFVTEKVLKSNKKKEVTALDIIITDSITGNLPYLSKSGGERVKAALSVILGLAEVKGSRIGVKPGFLFIDEPPFLDGPGAQAYCDALETIRQRYPGLKVMAITHDPAMKSRFPQSIDVVKTEEGSKVVYS